MSDTADDDFSIPDVIDAEEMPPDEGGDDFSLPDVAEWKEPEPEPEPPWYESLANFGTAAADGVTLGNAAEIGEWFIGDETVPEVHKIDGMEPTYVGRRGIDADEIYDTAESTTAGKLGKGAGMVGTGALATLAAGPAVAAQAGVGAATSGLAARGEGADWKDTLLSAGAGGALGGVGGVASKYVPQLSKWLGGEAVKNISLMSAFASPAKAALTYGAAKGASELMTRYPAQSAAAIRTVPAAASAVLTWAAQSVLASGNSGIADPADESRLTKALLSGDESQISAATFQMQSKYPAFQKRLQAEAESAQGGE